MSKDIFGGESPKDASDVETLKNLPPTVIWKTPSDDNSGENITSKIIKKSPEEDVWNFSISYKGEGNSDRLEFTISKDDDGWKSKIDNATPLFEETKNSVDELLKEFSMSTYSLNATFTNKHSAKYESSALTDAKNTVKEKEKNSKRLKM